MGLNLTKQEIQDIRDIIQKYKDVSQELLDYQKKADEIQTKVIELEKSLKDIKGQEDQMMDTLHQKYGEFGLQEIYNVLLVDEMMK